MEKEIGLIDNLVEDGEYEKIISWLKNNINKYELITETGHLKLDRVGYSSLAYPFAYGCIPRTWDEDGDPLDIEIVGVTEPLVPGSIVESRIIGVMKFDDGGAVSYTHLTLPTTPYV